MGSSYNTRREKEEDCKLALMAQNKEEWYIESGWSTHMTKDRNKFINLKEGKSDNVAFGNNSFVKIVGNILVDLGSDKAKLTNVLLAKELKHNLLSVIRMFDQEYNLTFNSQKCEIREADSRRLVATSIRNPNNIYILERVKRKNIESL